MGGLPADAALGEAPVSAAVERARGEAMRQYARAHDRWSEREQVMRLSGRDPDADEARAMAQVVLRAWDAERRVDTTGREST